MKTYLIQYAAGDKEREVISETEIPYHKTALDLLKGFHAVKQITPNTFEAVGSLSRIRYHFEVVTR